jgi:hypothetical protein
LPEFNAQAPSEVETLEIAVSEILHFFSSRDVNVTTGEATAQLCGFFSTFTNGKRDGMPSSSKESYPLVDKRLRQKAAQGRSLISTGSFGEITPEMPPV